jgi:hypothetical protein
LSTVAGCFGAEPETTEEKKTEVDDDNDETTEVVDLPPSLVLWNSSKIWD